MTENVSDTRSEKEFASAEDPLNMHRTALNETALVSKIANLIDKQNLIIEPRQGKTQVLVLSDSICEEQVLFSYLLPKGKFTFNSPRNIPVSRARYFDQSLLNFNQYFASDAIFVFCQVFLITAGTVKSNFKRTSERFVASDNAFLFVSSVKGTPACWEQFLYDVIVKQLGIPIYFLTMPCADLR